VLSAVVAAERWRLAQGAYPADLASLVPAYLEAVPVDPFSGAPLHYRAADDEIVVWSVGDDLTDDGGRRAEDKDASSGGDVVLRLRAQRGDAGAVIR
jgi:hypothetical protein